MATETDTTDSATSTDTTTDQTTDTTTAEDNSSTMDKSTDQTTEDDKTVLGADDAGEKTEDQEGENKAEANPLLGAPEGDYTITGLPEGVAVDVEVLGALTPIAKEIGLSDAAMSRLALAYNDTILPHVSKTLVANIEADVAAQRRDWANEVKLQVEGGVDAAGATVAPDKRFAGKTMAEVRATAARALDQLGPPGLREFLETTGLGNNPALVSFAFMAGEKIKEDSDVVRGEGVVVAKGARPVGGLDTDSFYKTDS